MTAGAGAEIAFVALQGDHTRLVGTEKHGAPVKLPAVSVTKQETAPATDVPQ